MKHIGLAITIGLLLSGCSQNMFNFTLVSTRNIELSRLSSFDTMSERVEGEDKAHLVILIPTKLIRIDQAIDNTIAATPGCVALLDGTIHQKFWWIPYIYGQQKFVVEATPLVDPKYTSAEPVLPKYGRVNFNADGTLRSIKAISEAAYQSEKEQIVGR